MATIPAQPEAEILDIEVPHQALAVPASVTTPVTTPMAMIQRAVEKGASLEQIDKLIALKERIEADEARKAYHLAMAAFKAHDIRVLKDKKNGQYNSMYVSIGNLVKTVTPFLSQHGLSMNWDQDQSNGIRVTCTITHELGHSQSVSMVVPLDDSGKKNPIQQIKSSITYARACTFEAVCGLAASDANRDDDGNGAGQSSSATIELDNLAERLEWIANSKDRDELMKFYRAAYNDAQKLGDKDSIRAILAAKDARKKELGL